MEVELRDSVETRGLTSAGYRWVAVITILSVLHHADHLLRGFTGWPFEGSFNPFSGSLFVYPVIALGVYLSVRGAVGPGFWSALAGGAMVFLLIVHVGPAAGDSLADIPRHYDSALAGALAVAILLALVLSLLAHCVYESRRLLRATRRW